VASVGGTNPRRATPSYGPPYKQHFIGYLIPEVVFGSLAVMIDAIRKRQDVAKEKLAFGASAVYLVGMLVGAAFALYPAVLPASSDRAVNLTIDNTAAGHHGLTVGLTWWILGMILALGHFTLLFRMFRGEVRFEGEGY
jgi:cytochrome bd ubiquinol oxidase subunit II